MNQQSKLVPRRRKIAWGAALATGAMILSGCGATAPDPSASGGTAPVGGLQDSTPAAVGDYGPITWANYRPTASLDPVQALDQPENGPLNALCEGLLMQEPDGSMSPWLADSVEYVSPTELSVKLKDDTTFWDGSPVTSDDVVFSLERAKDPERSYYVGALASIQSVEAVDDRNVKITLSQPDYWLRGQLATSAGIVVQKKFAESAGADYGTAPGNVMCSGAFTIKSWQAGGDLTVERNPEYWDEDNAAKVSEITFVASPGGAELTAGLLSGEINGTFNPVLNTYNKLKDDKNMRVVTGPSTAQEILAVVDFDGVLGDVKVRQALSLAIDRDAYISVAYPGGQASVPRSATNVSVWKADEAAFAEAFPDAAPIEQDLDEAKRLIAEAGAEGATVTIATTSLPSVTAVANAVVQAGTAIGLNVELKSFAVADFASVFYDPAAREGIDAVNNVVGAPFLAPGLSLTQFVLPDSPYNLGGWTDPEVTDLLSRAAQTEDASERAVLEAQADRIVFEALPVIPLVDQTNTVAMTSNITGAPAAAVGYMSGPWARLVGASAE